MFIWLCVTVCPLLNVPVFIFSCDIQFARKATSHGLEYCGFVIQGINRSSIVCVENFSKQKHK